jgi:signal recognition particle receptor subunit beta
VQDVGGQDKLRPYWRHYYTGTQGILFVVDACDGGRLDMAAAELRSLAADEQLAAAPIVVLVNKAVRAPRVGRSRGRKAAGLADVRGCKQHVATVSLFRMVCDGVKPPPT